MMELTSFDVGKTVYCIDVLGGCVVKTQIAAVFSGNQALLTKPCSTGFLADGADLTDNPLDAVAPLYALAL